MFKLPRAEGAERALELRASELAMILDGIDVSKLKRLPRYQRGVRKPAAPKPSAKKISPEKTAFM